MEKNTQKTIMASMLIGNVWTMEEIQQGFWDAQLKRWMKMIRDQDRNFIWIYKHLVFVGAKSDVLEK